MLYSISTKDIVISRNRVTISSVNNFVFKLLFNKTNRNVFKLKKCYETCVELERKQMTDIKTHTWDIACCLHQQPDQLVEAAQTVIILSC